MSNDRTQKQIDNLLGEFLKADKESQALLFEEINRELQAFLYKEYNDKDATDGAFDFLNQLSDPVQEEFDELLAGDSDKKRFVRTPSKISNA